MWSSEKQDISGGSMTWANLGGLGWTQADPGEPRWTRTDPGGPKQTWADLVLIQPYSWETCFWGPTIVQIHVPNF